MRAKVRATANIFTAPFVKPFRRSRYSTNDRNDAQAIAGENRCSPIVCPSCVPLWER